MDDQLKSERFEHVRQGLREEMVKEMSPHLKTIVGVRRESIELQNMKISFAPFI